MSAQAGATIEKHWPKAEWDALIQDVVVDVCGEAFTLAGTLLQVKAVNVKVDEFAAQMRQSEAKMEGMEEKIDAILAAINGLARGAESEIVEMEDSDAVVS